MKEGADLMQNLTHMTSLSEQLREMRKSRRRNSQSGVHKVVLGSLPGSYDNFLVSLNARNADDLDWENVKGLLIEEYIKR